jgi:hypothetical protein
VHHSPTADRTAGRTGGRTAGHGRSRSGSAGPPLEWLETQICELAGHLTAATYRFLALLGDFDARQGWAQWDLPSCAAWLSWKCQLSAGTAREHVRVARALPALPVLSAEFAAGRMSFAKIRALTRAGQPGRRPGRRRQRLPRRQGRGRRQPRHLPGHRARRQRSPGRPARRPGGGWRFRGNAAGPARQPPGRAPRAPVPLPHRGRPGHQPRHRPGDRLLRHHHLDAARPRRHPARRRAAAPHAIPRAAPGRPRARPVPVPGTATGSTSTSPSGPASPTPESTRNASPPRPPSSAPGLLDRVEASAAGQFSDEAAQAVAVGPPGARLGRGPGLPGAGAAPRAGQRPAQ